MFFELFTKKKKLTQRKSTTLFIFVLASVYGACPNMPEQPEAYQSNADLYKVFGDYFYSLTTALFHSKMG
jgi:hypothetical protein